jgi:hypothetical protein
MLDLKPPVKVSHHPTAQNNAAKIFAEDSRCKLTGKGVRNRLKTAMERLFSRGVIEVVETGSPSRLTSCIRRVERGVIVDFPSGRPAPSAPASEQPQGNGGEPDTVASVPFMLTAAQKRELHDVLGYSDEQIREMTPQQGQDIIAQRNKLAGVLAAWSTTIGPGQPHTVEQVIAAAEMAGTSDDEASDEFKRALAAVAPQGNGVALEQWLRENSGIEVNQLMLREADTDKDGRSQWMLELRVEPDRGGGAD